MSSHITSTPDSQASIFDGDWDIASNNGEKADMSAVVDFNATFDSDTGVDTLLTISTPASPPTPYHGRDQTITPINVAPDFGDPDFNTAAATAGPYYLSVETSQAATPFTPSPLRNQLFNMHRRSISEPPADFGPLNQSDDSVTVTPSIFTRSGQALGQPFRASQGHKPAGVHKKNGRSCRRHPTYHVEAVDWHHFRRADTEPLRCPTSIPIAPKPPALLPSQSYMSIGHSTNMIEPLRFQHVAPPPVQWQSSRVCTPAPHIDPRLDTAHTQSLLSPFTPDQSKTITMTMTADALKELVREAVEKALEGLKRTRSIEQNVPETRAEGDDLLNGDVNADRIEGAEIPWKAEGGGA